MLTCLLDFIKMNIYIKQLDIYICRYRIQLNVDDGTECAIFILFDEEAEKLLQTITRELSNKCATVRPYK